MASKHHKPEEIVAKLWQVEVLMGQGKTVVEAVRAIGVTEGTYYRWRAEYGCLGLARFYGHPEAITRGVPDAQDASAVFA